MKKIPLILLALLATLRPAFADDALPLKSDQVQKKASAQVDFRSAGAAGMTIRFDDPGWDSGVRLLPPGGAEFWDLSTGKLLAVDVENLSRDRQLRLTMHISSGRKEDKTFSMVNTGIGLNPGEKRTMNLLIPHRFVYGAPESIPGPRIIESDRVNWIELYMQWPFEKKAKDLASFRLSNLRLVGQPDAPHTKPDDAYFPFIDKYGQFMHADWPEKIRSDADLRAARSKELAELNASRAPAEWNRYGGWANGPRLKATGHFRTEKHNGKWWLVDPEGRLFFSHGIDVLYTHTDSTRTQDHKHWFDFPIDSWVVQPTDTNLAVKYGTRDYDDAFYGTLQKRLPHWGMNTIGNWGNHRLILRGGIPYTLQLSDYNAKLPVVPGNLKFYDVFDPAYIEAMENLIPNAAQRNPAVEKSLTDPYCIGYFIDNELNYGNRGRQIFGDSVMKSPAHQAAKQEFADDMRAKYGSIEKLNASWETNYADWDAFLAADAAPSPDAKGYRADSNAFFEKAVDQYFRLCRDAIKTRAPHRLYLGSRFISTDAVRPVLYRASEKYCDVLTLNVYAHSVANLGAGTDFPDMPALIGEFHFGILDRGMFAPGLAPVGYTQAERALAYTRFLQGALVHPNIVGTHWFQFRDQPLTGRWDGEGYQIGFVDVADTPYRELTAAAREVGEHMYGYRARGLLKNDMK